MEGKYEGRIHLPENLTERFQALLKNKDRLIILLLGGVLLLVIALPVSDHNSNSTDRKSVMSEAASAKGTREGDAQDYASYLEEKLENTLSKVNGVGRVKVMVTLKASSERVIEKDVSSEEESVQETDSQGGNRSTVNSSSSQSTVYEGGSGAESGTPYITKELTPVVEGVVIIAQGGGDAVVVQNITEAVQALFEIDTHKIKVMKSN